MVDLKAFTVGLGFILAVIIYSVHRIKLRSEHKKKIAEIKNRRKKNKKKRKK